MENLITKKTLRRHRMKKKTELRIKNTYHMRFPHNAKHYFKNQR